MLTTAQIGRENVFVRKAFYRFFLPSLCRPMGNLFLYLPSMFLMISAVEVIQVMTACGSGDVDDLILNLAGALACWLVLWPLSRHINNVLRRNRYDS